jgi:hypothetical protein
MRSMARARNQLPAVFGYESAFEHPRVAPTGKGSTNILSAGQSGFEINFHLLRSVYDHRFPESQENEG